jgi:epoxyqueuosine reductase QueG
MKYVLPEAESAVCWAVPLNRDLIRPYLSKSHPEARADHERDNIEVNVKVTKMSFDLAKMLKEKGYKAKGLVANNKYREDMPGWRVSLPPELSIRYVAVRSGVASFGWSGNVGLKGYGTTIIIGATVTSAKLQPTDPLPPEEEFCVKCKLCVKTCAFRMFSEDETTEVTLGGKTFSYSKRVNKSRCIITCAGFNGLDKTGKWSTWSPGRFEYPETKKEVARLLPIALTSHARRPLIKDSSKGYVPAALSGKSTDDQLGAIDKFSDDQITDKLMDEGKSSKGAIQLTCGNCAIVCWGDQKETAENYRLLTNSGCVIQKEDGELVILPPDKAQEEFDKMDPKLKRRYTRDYKKRKKRTTMGMF